MCVVSMVAKWQWGRFRQYFIDFSGDTLAVTAFRIRPHYSTSGSFSLHQMYSSGSLAFQLSVQARVAFKSRGNLDGFKDICSSFLAMMISLSLLQYMFTLYDSACIFPYLLCVNVVIYMQEFPIPWNIYYFYTFRPSFVSRVYFFICEIYFWILLWNFQH